MLFVLTGNIQTGKTRWLEQLIDELANRGVPAYGVIAPGVWADRRANPDRFPHADANGFEKLGIDNVLLPGGERIAFARRRDLAIREGTFDANGQSGKAQLGWSISESALERVNAHFALLRAMRDEPAASSAGMLVVDELGRLELERGGGLTEALALLDDGPNGHAGHALIVVREQLLPCLDGRFETWGEKRFVKPELAAIGEIVDETVRN